MYSLVIHSTKRADFINITSKVQQIVGKAKTKEGLLTLFVPHTTAGITINENADPDVLADIEKALEKTVPWHNNWSHTEGNAASHIKSSMFGCSLQMIISEGTVQLGTWQAIYFCEFDGPRERNIWIQIVPAV
jgi:secondary thiamine-phosphate synthase enzyme